MNWYQKLSAKDGEKDWGVLDVQLLCCGFEENRRPQGEEYKPKKGKNYPKQPDKPRLENERKPELLP